MSLSVFQGFLLKLYTNRKTRDDFFADPKRFLEKNYSDTLSEKEKKALTQLDRAPLDLFARSLAVKRYKEMERILSAPNGAVVLVPWRRSNPSIYFFSHRSGKLEHCDISDGQYAALRGLVGGRIKPDVLARRIILSGGPNLLGSLELFWILQSGQLWGRTLAVYP